MKSKASVILSGILVLLGLALAAVVLGTPLHWQAPEVQLPAPESLAPVSLQHVRSPDGGFTDQVERPLFVAGRRPVTVEVVQSGDEANKDLQMLGLYDPDDGTGGAIISLSGSVRRVAIGAKVGALTLVRIDGLEAVFWDGAAEVVLRLKPLPRLGASSAPAATAAYPAGSPPKRAAPPAPVESMPAVDDGEGAP